MVIYSFLKLPIFVTVPIVVFILLFAGFYSVLALYYLALDAKSCFGRLITGSGKIRPPHNHR